MIRGGPGARAFGRCAFSLIELLVAVGVVSLLVAILVPTAGQARKRAKAVVCAANLRSVGQIIHAFADEHNDFVAPVIRERDYYWDRGKQIGWDIETGRWADLPGGTKTVWQCPGQDIAFVGNARALGLDNREALPHGILHRVGRRNWHEPGRLVLAYDLQSDLPETSYAHALDPMAGDLSDEAYMPWPLSPYPFVRFGRDTLGPHNGGFGVLFGDGHARVDKFPGDAEAVLWSGRRWW